MIRDSRQLKAKVKQLTKGDSHKSQVYIRLFFMERFLERISQSPYSDQFILKGGLLIASLVGLDLRSTMDIDSTVKGLPLNLEEAELIVQEIIKTPVGEAVNFVITKATQIMGEHDYPGKRFALQGSFDGIRQAIRIDLSTGDAITPQAVSYDYQLMFEERSIRLMTYNLETLLAENWKQ
ncbi:MAG: nucleotidyl transferase AbiEii/AbiGii toxin family protein [Bacillota bacterium]|nr:nucleotidyl transferase AbiEii/AbiGii toxin family protein [Bacillota bacterium]